MNNLHRELAPISEAAWAEIEDEARRTFTRNVGGRRVVDVVGPSGVTLSAVGTGHLRELDAHVEGVRVRQRLNQPVVELRVPFTVTRQAVDDVERGAKDSDWQPVKDAAKRIGFAEDRTIFDGSDAAGIVGIGPFSSNAPLPMPEDVREFPDTVARAMSALRLAGVAGPYSLLLSAEAYTAVAETTDHGYPIHQHLARLLKDGEIIWAPALEGALLVSTRGGDYELHLGQDLAIGYLAHDANVIELYLQESLTFLALTAEASVSVR
ncbi:MAG: bacteriocin family protein [Hamadaea sp.]|uniref:family 1 encapsulin nanocompartment shell protein n=1 Tax=Hamadaea sp. TaxID=2024425 RepID=UPI0017ED5421|nr:family 1 encapsulin nanocompartment shell protein [Hamadaea sp.]NUR69688.1 bacteriocin family protein [Hamadaea sp.]NUT19555.1 bacteriocin family protein [Hamadaea sp.]